MTDASVSIDIRDRFTRIVPTKQDDRFVLQGERDWIIQGSEAPLDEIQEALGSLYERISSTLLVVHFGNAIGFFKLPYLGTIEVVSGKWTQNHFDHMLAEIMEVMSALPFTAGTGGALPYDRTVITRSDVLYHIFLYLRYILSESAPRQEQLLPALQLIFSEPHSRFERLQNLTPLDRVRHVSDASLIQILQAPEKMVRVSNAASGRLPLAHALQGYLPTSIPQKEVQHTNDTPENRFILSFLKFAMGIVDRMEEAITDNQKSLFFARLRHDCETMKCALAQVLRHPLWQEVGSMIHFPAASTVLQRRRGYRDVFRHFNKLRLGSRIPLSSQQLHDLVEAKDIALLYELWAFFSVAHTTEVILGPPSRANTLHVTAFQSSVPHDVEIVWKNGTRLFYNPSFSRSAHAKRRSYSVPLRPDIALDIPAGPNKGLHLFDAKFRLDAMKSPLSQDEENFEAVVSEERRGKFKLADLYKMHAYRDAIVDAHTVWILYPGTEFKMFHSDAVVYSAIELLPTTLDGVGAIPLQPGEANASPLTRVLTTLLTGAF